MSIPKF